MDATSLRSIEGFGPLPVQRPDSVEATGVLVRQARDQGQAIYPVGGGTQLTIGRVPARPGTVLDLTALTQVIDYPARDMTITVQAGMRMADLEQVLTTENQRLPIDIPRATTATVGGILATNTSGPRRLGFGTLRDYLIGITVLDDHGRETHAGGRVVKNVAGYDLCKLHIGALGTLGIITQATFKLRPIPAETALLTCFCTADKLDAVLTQLSRSRTHPVAIEALAEPGGDRFKIVIGLEEFEAAVNWQTSQLLTELAPLVDHVEVTAGTAASGAWQGLIDGVDRACVVALKANLLPSGVAAFCRALARRPEGWALQAHAGSGIVRAFASEGVTREQVELTLKELLPQAQQSGGNIVVPRCPPEWKRGLPIWGAARGDVLVMRRIKQALDPLGVFNPGRFLDGVDTP